MGIPHNPCSDLANLETCATVNESNTEYSKIIVVDYGDGVIYLSDVYWYFCFDIVNKINQTFKLFSSYAGKISE